MALVLWLLMALVPYLIGMGALRILYGKQTTQEMRPADYILTGAMICMGLAEIAHLGAVMLGWSFSRCVNVFVIAVLLVTLAAGTVVVLMALVAKRKREWLGRSAQACESGTKGMDAAVKIAWIGFAGLVLVQLIYVLTCRGVYVDGDMTLETVNTFVTTDSVYQVNPMTGRPYTLGVPLRLKILCLPTLYGALSVAFGIETEVLVYGMIPAFVLLGSYLAYSTLAEHLFGRDLFKKGTFMVLVALLLGSAGYLYGMDGFGVLNSGFRGVAIRGAILLPYTVGLVLRQKYKLVVLCILAETCIVWTFYGMGACILVAVGMVTVQWLCTQWIKRQGRREDDVNGTPE